MLKMSILPPVAEFRFPWEMSSVKDGESVRTFGRLVSYQPEESRATLSAQHASKEHQVFVKTVFVEPFNPIIGAQYLVLGEADISEELGVVIRARVFNCVDGVNIALLQKAISHQRSFFRERESKRSDSAPPADST
ncbi:CST complex subunit TEN1 [Kryptolebias marmoratus]|uniref:CST complex subunit TEN1 n=1 Tax=Kryptolebias marmoratus TaxID=37003 RepID=A0A3Q3AGJ7_KRYMA|nr:CST complex subunit TEN1 [Kryptolebias marmoratus]XP_037830714.1 CST complex subunit TEN1 [Kryptolebias marmoratus]XP_037830715.1 CST complex subunit TEN1 [Kryptolebias marmoratus]